jgi:hypothetical protein
MNTPAFTPSATILSGLRDTRPGMPWPAAAALAQTFHDAGFPSLALAPGSPSEFTQTLLDDNGAEIASSYFAQSPEAILTAAGLAWEPATDASTAAELRGAIAAAMKELNSTLGPGSTLNQITEWAASDCPDQACVFSAFWPRKRSALGARQHSNPESFLAERAKATDVLTLSISAYLNETDDPEALPTWRLGAFLRA